MFLFAQVSWLAVIKSSSAQGPSANGHTNRCFIVRIVTVVRGFLMIKISLFRQVLKSFDSQFHIISFFRLFRLYDCHFEKAHSQEKLVTGVVTKNASALKKSENLADTYS